MYRCYSDAGQHPALTVTEVTMYALFENSEAIAVAHEQDVLAPMAQLSTYRSIKRIHRGEAIFWYKRGAAFCHTPWLHDYVSVEARKGAPVKAYGWTKEEMDYADAIGERAYDGC